MSSALEWWRGRTDVLPREGYVRSVLAVNPDIFITIVFVGLAAAVAIIAAAVILTAIRKARRGETR